MVSLETQAQVEHTTLEGAVWFPRHISELRKCCTAIRFGVDLTEDHPGYEDDVYVERRKEIAKIAMSYNYDEEIPRIKYTETEICTWAEVYRKQSLLYPTHACKEYNTQFPRLFAECDYREDNIPQLEDISHYIHGCTGWRLWPVIGWISNRYFLNALAFKCFPSCQYIRHHSCPLYTPEPDICHEVIGHVPLLCDPKFAEFTHELGLASLGISDEWIEKLASLYWFTVEYGMVKGEDGKPRAFGAGLMSGSEELQYCVTEKPTRLPLDIEVAVKTPYPVTSLQPLYFVAESMEDMMEKLMYFSKSIPRNFSVNYDLSTLSAQVCPNN